MRMLRDPVWYSTVREQKVMYFSEGGTVQISDAPGGKSTVHHEVL